MYHNNVYDHLFITSCNIPCLCAGIRQLQLILLKVALVLGVEVLTAVEFQGLEEPSGNKGATM